MVDTKYSVTWWFAVVYCVLFVKFNGGAFEYILIFK